MTLKSREMRVNSVFCPCVPNRSVDEMLLNKSALNKGQYNCCYTYLPMQEAYIAVLGKLMKFRTRVG